MVVEAFAPLSTFSSSFISSRQQRLHVLTSSSSSSSTSLPASLSDDNLDDKNNNNKVEDDNDDFDDPTQSRIQQLVHNHAVVLFMKGSKLFPQCGFSNTAIQILNALLQSPDRYHTIDVLSDDDIRQGVKLYSQWPTIPQLYVGGEFIGGSDIMIELYQNGELGELLEKAQAEQM